MKILKNIYYFIKIFLNKNINLLSDKYLHKILKWNILDYANIFNKFLNYKINISLKLNESLY